MLGVATKAATVSKLNNLFMVFPLQCEECLIKIYLFFRETPNFLLKSKKIILRRCLIFNARDF